MIPNLLPNINLQSIEIIIYYIYFWETDHTSTCDKYLAVVNLWPRSVNTCACQRSGSVGHNTHRYSHRSTHKYPQVYNTHAHPYYPSAMLKTLTNKCVGNVQCNYIVVESLFLFVCANTLQVLMWPRSGTRTWNLASAWPVDPSVSCVWLPVQIWISVL